MKRNVELTFGTFFLEAAERRSSSDFLIFLDTRHTYGSMRVSAMRRAASFLASGIKPGEHVGLLMSNCPVYIECLLGLQFIGAIVVPINARYKAHELAYVLSNAEITTVVTHDLISEYANFGDLLLEAISTNDLCQVSEMVMFGRPRIGFIDEHTFDARADQISAQEILNILAGIKVSDTSMMMYTSGTTADPKGCPLHHGMLIPNGINMNRSRYFLTSTDRLWAPLPMFHMASILPMLCCIDAGAAFLSMIHFEPGLSLQIMEEEKVTIAFPCFPTVTAALISHVDFGRRDLSNIRRINNSAAPDVLKTFQAAFPQAIQTGAYGLTESGGVIAFNHPNELLSTRLTTCGKPMPGLEAKIIDPDTLQPRTTGEKGEILLRGYAIFKGYYKSPEKNKQSFYDGWFRTGDLGALTAGGQIEFHGRLKDMLKVGGENVAAIEIESLLSQHDAVKVAQVIGVPDKHLFEVACAYIECHKGQTVNEKDLILFCRGKIASFKIPRHVRKVHTWPMSSTKIQKYILREWFNGEVV